MRIGDSPSQDMAKMREFLRRGERVLKEDWKACGIREMQAPDTRRIGSHA